MFRTAPQHPEESSQSIKKGTPWQRLVVLMCSMPSATRTSQGLIRNNITITYPWPSKPTSSQNPFIRSLRLFRQFKLMTALKPNLACVWQCKIMPLICDQTPAAAWALWKLPSMTSIAKSHFPYNNLHQHASLSSHVASHSNINNNKPSSKYSRPLLLFSWHPYAVLPRHYVSQHR